MSVGVLIPVVIFGAILPAVGLGFLFVYISRRRAARNAKLQSDTAVESGSAKIAIPDQASPKKAAEE